MPIAQLFAPLDSQWLISCADIRLRLTTDQPCRSIMWYSPNPPRRKLIYRPVRGVMVPCGHTYSFRPIAAYNQLESGQTLLHTYDPFNWIEGTIGFYAFSFFLPTGLSRSQTPIIKATRPPDPEHTPLWGGLQCSPPYPPPPTHYIIGPFWPGATNGIYIKAYATAISPPYWWGTYPFVDWVYDNLAVAQAFLSLTPQTYCVGPPTNPGTKVELYVWHAGWTACWTEYGTID